jgi:hypothetical protein
MHGYRTLEGWVAGIYIVEEGLVRCCVGAKLGVVGWVEVNGGHGFCKSGGEDGITLLEAVDCTHHLNPFASESVREVVG